MAADYLKVGDLLTVIRDNNLPNDVAVCYQRIEDEYFTGIDIGGMRGSGSSKYPGGVFPEGTKTEGWNTLKIKGDTYFRAVRHNKQLDLGKLVNEGIMDADEVAEYYWHDKYKDDRKYFDLESEEILDQYIKGFCCFYNKEKNILCITAHY